MNDGIKALLAEVGGMGGNAVVFNSVVKAYHVLQNYKNIMCSISGGSDSDVVLDLIWRVGKCLNKEVKYVWFDTGLEFMATKNHLKYLEDRYQIEIIREKAKKPIPITCKQYGQPFINKQVSEYIYRLQLHDFKWEDRPFEELLAEYPKCVAALRWWCGIYDKPDYTSMLSIQRNKYLKEFMVQNPPTFKASSKCCEYAKKKVIHNALEKYDADLNIYGVRKAEGGMRATAYKTCYDDNGAECSSFRPIFWYNDEDKQYYERKFNIVHSDCYTKYGMRRTGCAGCPFSKTLDEEVQIIKTHEPNLYKAVSTIFKESYEYTAAYRKFCAEQRAKDRSDSNKSSQIKLFDVSSEVNNDDI